MNEPNFNYDEISDTLTISFFPGESATGIELNENILLRINKQEQYAVSLSIFNYSILAQKTEAGLRSLPLTGLQELSDALRKTVLAVLLKKPLSDILAISTYTPSLSECADRDDP
ncbi:MAG: DUF2283 domain-containing protein [Caldilineaceae bacterium]